MNFLKSKKGKFILLGIAAALIVFIVIISIVNSSKKKDIIDLGPISTDIVLSEEQLQEHYMLIRNTSWGDSYDDILDNEAGNVLSSQANSYIVCDYETLFGYNALPVYLFDNSGLISITYLFETSNIETSAISKYHQNIGAGIYSTYPNLYKENNIWSSGQDRIYDINLWSSSIMNGTLTMQSVWNGVNEKVFLVTSKTPYFNFLDKEKGVESDVHVSMVILSNDYLRNDSFKSLVNRFKEVSENSQ